MGITLFNGNHYHFPIKANSTVSKVTSLTCLKCSPSDIVFGITQIPSPAEAARNELLARVLIGTKKMGEKQVLHTEVGYSYAVVRSEYGTLMRNNGG